MINNTVTILANVIRCYSRATYKWDRNAWDFV